MERREMWKIIRTCDQVQSHKATMFWGGSIQTIPVTKDSGPQVTKFKPLIHSRKLWLEKQILQGSRHQPTEAPQQFTPRCRRHSTSSRIILACPRPLQISSSVASRRLVWLQVLLGFRAGIWEVSQLKTIAHSMAKSKTWKRVARTCTVIQIKSRNLKGSTIRSWPPLETKKVGPSMATSSTRRGKHSFRWKDRLASLVTINWCQRTPSWKGTTKMVSEWTNTFYSFIEYSVIFDFNLWFLMVYRHAIKESKQQSKRPCIHKQAKVGQIE